MKKRLKYLDLHHSITAAVKWAECFLMRMIKLREKREKQEKRDRADPTNKWNEVFESELSDKAMAGLVERCGQQP